MKIITRLITKEYKIVTRNERSIKLSERLREKTSDRIARVDLAEFAIIGAKACVASTRSVILLSRSLILFSRSDEEECERVKEKKREKQHGMVLNLHGFREC
jgi:hypothetical protein